MNNKDTTTESETSGQMKVFLPNKLLECLPRTPTLPKERLHWNTNEEIASFLISFDRHDEWLSCTLKTRPQNGSVILYNRKKVKYRKDGYCWKKRKDGKTTREDHMKLKVQGMECLYGCYVHSSIVPTFHRRCYWLLQNPDIVLVHYLNVPSLEDSVKSCGPVSSALTDRRDSLRWSRDELLSQLKPMFNSIKWSCGGNSSVELSVEQMVQQILETQQTKPQPRTHTCLCELGSTHLSLTRAGGRLVISPVPPKQDTPSLPSSTSPQSPAPPNQGVATLSLTLLPSPVIGGLLLTDTPGTLLPPNPTSPSPLLLPFDPESFLNSPKQGQTYGGPALTPHSLSASSSPSPPPSTSPQPPSLALSLSPTSPPSSLSSLSSETERKSIPGCPSPSLSLSLSPARTIPTLLPLCLELSLGLDSMSSPLSGGVKLLITGPWSETDSRYSCVFDQSRVPASLIQPGVLRCYCPAHEAGLVALHVLKDSSAVSSSVLFEYRARNASSLPSSQLDWLSLDDNQFRMSILERLEQMERRMAEMSNNNQQNQHMNHYHQQLSRNQSHICIFKYLISLLFVYRHFGQCVFCLMMFVCVSLSCVFIRSISVNSLDLEQEVDPLNVDHFSCTPLMWACALGHQAAAVLLYRWSSAALGIPDSLGRLPLAVAHSRGHTRLARCLEELHTHSQTQEHTPDTPSPPYRPLRDNPAIHDTMPWLATYLDTVDRGLCPTPPSLLSDLALQRLRPPSSVAWAEFLNASANGRMERDFALLTLTDTEQRELYEAARIIQNAFRRYKGRRLKEQQDMAAAVIQRCYRKYKQYALYKKMTQAAILIQSKFRSYYEQKKFQQSRRAAVLIQQYYRSYKEYERVKQGPRGPGALNTRLKGSFLTKKQDQAARKIMRFLRRCRHRYTGSTKMNPDLEPIMTSNT
uniref:Calmodulin binding transcription activator 2 n=1 Tax=Sinocyclocheilus grahami TaxID=75366 RepID=A0A672NF00_SINGR